MSDTLTPLAPQPTDTEVAPAETEVQDVLLEQDQLVEEVSIDGMCGVY